jgi:signal transduction histidine kinase
VTKRLLFSYLGLAVLVLAVLEIPLGIVNGRDERSNLTTKVERDASFLASFAEDALESGKRPSALGVAAADYAKRTGARVVIVDRRGISVVDTNPPVKGPRTFATRPEIKTALSGRVATGTRYSKTLHERLLFVAVPASSGTTVTGAVRITYPTSSVDERVLRYWLILLAIAGVVLAVAAAAGLRFARWVSSPLARLEATTAEAAGDLSSRAQVEGPPEVRSLAAAFNHMISELEQLVRSQEEFVANASHQLRTPLTALRLRLEVLGRDLRGSNKADLERALEEVERLSRLVDGLLALARAEVSPAERIELAGLVDERVEAWSALAAEREVKIETSVAGTVLAGRDRLGQALENLLSNALAVSPPGATVRVEGSSGELHVIDQGPGMNLEEIEHAFDRFWRGGETEAGSGLGLAIVRHLVETDGGAVELRSAPSGGIDAVIRLPVR